MIAYKKIERRIILLKKGEIFIKKKILYFSIIFIAVIGFLVIFSEPTKAYTHHQELDGAQVYIKNAYSGRYLDVYMAIAGNGANVQQCQFNGNANQRWVLMHQGNGLYKIGAVLGSTVEGNVRYINYFLDVNGGNNPDNNVNIQLWRVNDSVHQTSRDPFLSVSRENVTSDGRPLSIIDSKQHALFPRSQLTFFPISGINKALIKTAIEQWRSSGKGALSAFLVDVFIFCAERSHYALFIRRCGNIYQRRKCQVHPPGLLRCLRRAEEHLDPASGTKARLQRRHLLRRFRDRRVRRYRQKRSVSETGPFHLGRPALAADGRTGRAHVLRYHVSRRHTV